MATKARQRDGHTTQSGEGRRTGTADPGSYIGHEPERATETIPGGLSRKDQRVSAIATQPGASSPEERHAEGHREASNADSDTKREAGQNR